MTAGRPPQHSERATIEIDSDSHEDEEEHSDIAGAQEAEVGPSGSAWADGWKGSCSIGEVEKSILGAEVPLEQLRDWIPGY